VTLVERRLVGRDHLAALTRLLQDARLAEPDGGAWEAADVQWWWRVDQRPEPEGQPIWFDGDVPFVAAVFTRWNGWVGCDLLGRDAAVTRHSDLLWRQVRETFTDREVSMVIRDDDPVRIAAAKAAGFAARDEAFVMGWMDPARRPSMPPLPVGIRIEPYDGGPHHMVKRSGEHVAARLAECSLYRPDLDLAVRDGDTLAGYALFWADPVTGVGLLEPMRIEDGYQGRGLAKALIAQGMDRLARAGCTRLKVSWEPANEPAVRLYSGAGYQPRATAHTWTRAATISPP
jgi:ribosomal protein S18 acetylase RimI-like enzyme